MRTLVWFRQDLRLTDQPALYEAARLGEVIPVYIWSPEEEGIWQPGLGARSWLIQSLQALDASLGGKLILKKGPTKKVLKELLVSTKAENLFFNRRYEPEILKRDAEIVEAFQKAGITTRTFNASLLIEPWELESKQKKPYQVFTPFWRTALKNEPYVSIGQPKCGIIKPKEVQSLRIDSLECTVRPLPGWKIGEEEAQRKLTDLVENKLETYLSQRDCLAVEAVSRLSPHLHFGEISPRQIWEKVHQTGIGEAFLRQLYWREFAYHLLFHFPKTPLEPLREEFNYFLWSDDERALEAWRRGMTGYPIVDAGMRQLMVEGWMHNRARLIVASFLTKDLLIPWQEGARWFWEHLVDADLANNTLGWQWTAGCGADAAPYFRIFNPVSQSERFDPEGNYIRKFVPELKHLDETTIHAPWRLKNPPSGYPLPIIDHQTGRERALKHFEKIKKQKGKK